MRMGPAKIDQKVDQKKHTQNIHKYTRFRLG